MENKSLGALLSDLNHVGVMVSDMDSAVAHYQALGLGPFEPLNISVTDRKVYGKPAPDVENLAMVTEMGPVGLELIQAVAGQSVQREFLDCHGEGINHIAFRVDDIEEATAIMVDEGFEVISSAEAVGGGGIAYFDTDKVGGVQIELLELPPHVDRLSGGAPSG